MKLIKILVKTVALPIALLLGILRLAVRIAAKVSSLVLGGLILVVFVCIILTIFSHSWNSTMILSAVEVFLILLTVGTGLLEGLLQIASESLGNYLRS